MGELKIQYHEEDAQGQLLVSNEFPRPAWNSLIGIILKQQPDADVFVDHVIADWPSILPAIGQLSALKRDYGFKVIVDESAKKYIQRYASEYSATRDASGKYSVDLSPEEIPMKLQMHGFIGRELIPTQIRDLRKVASLKHAANFSVPGAGKTTVALATHVLTKDVDTHLLVVAPKNAFEAWDEVIKDCMHPEVKDIWTFVQLTGGREAIASILSTPPARSIISYDQLLRVWDLVAHFLATRKVHMICDESHKIKGGERSKKGNILLKLAHLPVRKDILSGTPLPHAISDISPQINFLWPGQSLGDEIIKSSRPSALLQPLYARTTKRELNLPPIVKLHRKIPMSSAQLALYGLLSSEFLKRRVGINGGGIDLDAARRSIMRLLQVSSNPILAIRSLTENRFEKFEFRQHKMQSIFEKIIQEWDSPKILEACRLARELASQGHKCVIWSSFRENVERIAELLRDLGATFIHGDVATGDKNDLNTREGRIALFHDSDSCFVIVANPAACGEGISLHKVCHHAIYVDRTFNAAHQLQSEERIHRLGLPKDIVTYVYILESVTPVTIGSIDYSVRRRLITKLKTMSAVLDDIDLHQLALGEEGADIPGDMDISIGDLQDIINELSGIADPPNDDEVI